MPRIILLDSTVSDQIAAGEVVERPSSVVKELVENALDAGARSVRVELEDAGRSLVRVSDDGDGMEPADLSLSVLRHATSKIRSADDLLDLHSFGFRGEALPSIASVSMLRIVTRPRGGAEANALEVAGGVVGECAPAARAPGTTVEVRRLFYNVPARLKFLRSDSTELSRCQGDLLQMALAHPKVAFHFVLGPRGATDLPAVREPAERLRQLWGASLADAALPVERAEQGMRIRGWVAPPQMSRGNRAGQWLYINGRVVEHRQLGFHLGQAFGSLLPHGRHAVAALMLELPAGEVDVNVHPAKREVRFKREGAVLDFVRHAVSDALAKANLFAGMNLASAASNVSESRLSFEGHTAEAMHPPAYPEAGPGGNPSFPGFEGPRGGSAAENWGQSGPDLAQPSHVQKSPWSLPVPVATRQDWPVPLAELHRSYLLCQDSQGLVVVDQHAAHERVLYERQLKSWAQHGVKSQKLLLPQRVQVPPAQVPVLEEWVAPLSDLGLELESVGDGTFFVASLPEFMKQVQASALIADLLEEPQAAQPRSGDPSEDFRREAAARLACRAAIKAGDPITWEAMQGLMADLSACEIPWCCPHGRPPLVRVSLVELEKHFQRR